MTMSCDLGRWKREIGQEIRSAESACDESTIQGHVCAVLKTGSVSECILLEVKDGHTLQTFLGLIESRMYVGL